MCLAGVVVVSYSLTQEVAGSSPFNEKYVLSLNFENSVKTFRENSNETPQPKCSNTKD